MKKIKFSVLMSVYAKEKRSNLDIALKSVINQTLKPNQIVLVEDGILTDELENLIISYEKKYDFMTVVRLEKNVGLGKALSEGLKYCNYDYVARMDSDDISLSNRFEKQILYIKENPNIDVIGGNIIEFDDITNEDISLRIVPRTNEEIKNYLKKRNPMNHVTVLFKKDSVLKSEGYLDCKYFEDYYLWSRMLKDGCKFANVQDVLVRVRAGLSMSSRRGNFTYIKNIIFFEKKLLNMKIINNYEFLYNVLTRSIVSILPNRIRYYIYQRGLRNEKN